MELEIFLGIYPYVVLGIAISVVLPILKKAIPTPSRESKYANEALTSRIWPIAKPYVIIGIVSLIIGILVVAISGNTLEDWTTALMAGFTWDSILQKVGT